MPVRRYGIYLLYPPRVKLTGEGLGRLLAAFLRGSSSIDDVRFVVVCPSWLTGPLRELLVAEQVPLERIEIHAPRHTPLLLALHNWLVARRAKLRPGWRSRLKARVRLAANRNWNGFLRALCGATVGPEALRIALPLTKYAVILAALTPVLFVAWIARSAKRRRWRLRLRSARVGKAKATYLGIEPPKDEPLVLRAYRLMEEAEAERMHEIIEAMPDVQAWYCPTAFWPSFNKIKSPKLMCVPDVVVSEFPVAFAELGPRFEDSFSFLTSTVRAGHHFVTYSDTIKRHTLGVKFGIPAHRVTVIPHAPQDMSLWLNGPGAPNPNAVSTQQCRSLLMEALGRSSSAYTAGFANPAVKFLFYASQFRPNKNVITLLRAYEHLLRHQFIGHKLILTGKAKVLPDIDEFIAEHRLAKDVLCVSGLSAQELAAFYKLADVAVNPSLSEGGFPFTFSEALSVGTPVVMSSIPVTLEVITDPALQEMMLFDPYDWRDVAARISWAIDNRDALLARQRMLHRELASRTWGDVVNEHIAVLDRIADQPSAEAWR
ncbi:glycosyltransferase [Hyphomicrobium sp. NDB2Meth4]|uniref:glycosyltransferase n=1 Tax=Hyphomicrobium sp. NDB2Meth4 TaxID=1892846 RepID=UPI000930E927|nr:glycosyltransferase [Hyphomicrobium sp. NDB2Meth4]